MFTVDDCAHQILAWNDGTLEAVIEERIADVPQRLVGAVSRHLGYLGVRKELRLGLDFSRSHLTAEHNLASEGAAASAYKIIDRVGCNLLPAPTGHA